MSVDAYTKFIFTGTKESLKTLYNDLSKMKIQGYPDTSWTFNPRKVFPDMPELTAIKRFGWFKTSNFGKIKKIDNEWVLALYSQWSNNYFPHESTYELISTHYPDIKVFYLTTCDSFMEGTYSNDIEKKFFTYPNNTFILNTPMDNKAGIEFGKNTVSEDFQKTEQFLKKLGIPFKSSLVKESIFYPF